MGLAEGSRRPGHHCLPRGRERLRGRVVGRALATSWRPSSTRSRPAPRRPTRESPAGRVHGGTRPGRSRACPTRSTAGGPPRPLPPTWSSSTRTPTPTAKGFFELGAFDVSPGHGLLAWSADVNGHEEFTLRIRDLATGLDLADVLTGTYYGTAWSADERYLFYTMPDHAMRPHQVWRHELGATQADDVLVYEEPDERYNVDLELTRSERYIVITNEANTSTDVLVLPASRSAGHAPSHRRAPAGRRVPPGPLGRRLRHPHQPRRARLQGGHGRRATSPGVERWTDLVPHLPGRRITQVEPFAGHLVLHEWADALGADPGACGPTARSGPWPSTRPCTRWRSAPTPSTRPPRSGSATSR